MNTLEQLIEELERGSSEARCRAAKALGTSGDSRAIVSLIGVLRDKDSSVKLEARNALIHAAKPAVMPLIRSLEHEGGWSYVHEALLRIGKPTIQPLIDALAEQSLTSKAAFILFRLGKPAIKPLVQGLGRPDIREEVASVLSRKCMVLGEPVEEPLIKALTVPAYREGALLTLRQIVTADLRRYLPLFLRALSMLQRGSAIDDMKEHTRPLVPDLVNLLSGPSHDEASRALRMIGSPSTAYLVRLVKDNAKGEHVRCRAASILGYIGDPSGMEVLIKALDEETSLVSLRAAEALANMGDERALLPLLAVLNSGGGALSEKVVYVISDSPFLKQALSHFNRRARELFCSQCLSRFERQKVESRGRRSVVFFTCRKCHSVSHILENTHRVVVVLDRKWVDDGFDPAKLAQDADGCLPGTEPVSGTQLPLDRMRYVSGSRTLYVNWSRHRKPLDFDEVWVRGGGDRDVDEFVMKLRNDTDTKRRRRSRSVPVHICPNAGLSRAEVNLLRSTFGEVSIAAPPE